jgi:hypothetical protein
MYFLEDDLFLQNFRGDSINVEGFYSKARDNRVTPL